MSDRDWVFVNTCSALITLNLIVKSAKQSKYKTILYILAGLFPIASVVEIYNKNIASKIYLFIIVVSGALIAYEGSIKPQ